MSLEIIPPFPSDEVPSTDDAPDDVPMGYIGEWPQVSYKWAFISPMVQFVSKTEAGQTTAKIIPQLLSLNQGGPYGFASYTQTVSTATFDGSTFFMAAVQSDLIKIRLPPSLDQRTKQFEEDSKKVVKVSDACDAVDTMFDEQQIYRWVQLFFGTRGKESISIPEKIKEEIRRRALSQSNPRERSTKRYSPRKGRVLPKSL